MPIRTLADVLEIERVPIRERVPEQNVYQRLQGVCERTPDHIAIRAPKTGEVDEAPRDVCLP